MTLLQLCFDAVGARGGGQRAPTVDEWMVTRREEAQPASSFAV